MQLPKADPKSVQVNVTAGTGVDIEWKDGHRSHYTFQFLRDACPCAMCNDQREKQHRKPGEPEKAQPGVLPMFKPALKPAQVEPTGKYALRFIWNDGHETGIYSWDYLRSICPCPLCQAERADAEEAEEPESKPQPRIQ